MIRAVSLTLVVALLTGCTVTAVKMRHPATKEVATCGPYDLKFGIGHDESKRCISDFQRQGYERAPD